MHPIIPDTADTARVRAPKLFAASMLWLACVAYLFFLGMPAFVAQMGEGWHYTASQQGLVAMAEVAGNALGALLLVYVIPGRTALLTFACGLLALVSGNAAMIADPPIELALAERLLAGVGGGMVAGTAVRYLSLDRRADTLLTLMVLCQYLGMVLLVAVVAPRLGSIGQSLALCAVLAALSLPVLLFFTDRQKVAGESTSGQPVAVRAGSAWLVLVSMFFLYMTGGVAWTFLDSVGVAAGLSQEQVSSSVAVAAGPTVLVCLGMPLLLRKGLALPACLVLLAACATGAFVLSRPLTPWLLAAGTVALFVGWAAGGVALYAILPAYDPVGRHIALIPAFGGIGSALGSAAGGYLIEQSSSPSLAYQFGALSGVLAIAAIVAASWLAARRPVPSGAEVGGSQR